MRYWYDTEFYENGKTIDLISIGMVAEDGRELYLQNRGAKFKDASDWVYRNVYPFLTHFHMAGQPDCVAERLPGGFRGGGRCFRQDCPWRFTPAIFWGYYSAYDHVALCHCSAR